MVGVTAAIYKVYPRRLEEKRKYERVPNLMQYLFEVDC